MRAANYAAHEAGVSLIELIIGMALGLLLVTAIGMAYIASQRTQTLSLALSRQQENARIANYYLADGITRAGYRAEEALLPVQVFGAWPPIVAYNASSSLALDKSQQGSAYYSAFAQLDLTLSVNGTDFALNNVEQSSDVLGLLLEGDGDITGCLGSVITAGALRYEFFYINFRTQNTSGSKFEFECKAYEFDGSAWAPNPILPQPLADDIIGLQFEYGLDSNGDGSANRYIPWSDTVDPYEIVSIRYRMQVKGGSPVSNLGKSLTSVTEAEKEVREYSHEVSLKNLRR